MVPCSKLNILKSQFKVKVVSQLTKAKTGHQGIPSVTGKEHCHSTNIATEKRQSYQVQFHGENNTGSFYQHSEALFQMQTMKQATPFFSFTSLWSRQNDQHGRFISVLVAQKYLSNERIEKKTDTLIQYSSFFCSQAIVYCYSSASTFPTPFGKDRQENQVFFSYS